MSMHPQAIGPIPEETVRVARAAFPRGNTYMLMSSTRLYRHYTRVIERIFSKANCSANC